MSPRALKIALALSVALNLLVVCALVAAAFVIGTRWPEARHEGRRHAAMAIVGQLEPGPEAAVRAQLRDAALAARPDFRAAREARREAVALAAAEPFDREAVEAALARSREAELRGRARLESGVTGMLADVEPEERRRLAALLARRGPRLRVHGGGRGHADEAPPPAP